MFRFYSAMLNVRFLSRALSSVSISFLLLILSGCPDYYLHTDQTWWQCEGGCYICIAWSGDTCQSTSWKDAYLPDNLSSYMCSSTYSQAVSGCEAIFRTTIKDDFGLEDDEIISCSNNTGSPVDTDRYCGPGDECPTFFSVRLRDTLLALNPSYSEVEVYNGSSGDSGSVSGTIQFVEDPFKLTTLFWQSDDLFIGQDEYANPMMFYSGMPISGSLDDGEYTVPVGSKKFFGSVDKNDEGYAVKLTARSSSASGTLDFENQTFTLDYQDAYQGNSVAFDMEGYIINRPPVADFTKSTPTGCTIYVDASSSSDPDGGSDLKDYYWHVNGIAQGMGKQKTLQLQAGNNAIQLLVTDQLGAVSWPPKTRVQYIESCQ
jgi:hypothetical protein